VTRDVKLKCDYERALLVIYCNVLNLPFTEIPLPETDLRAPKKLHGSVQLPIVRPRTLADQVRTGQTRATLPHPEERVGQVGGPPVQEERTKVPSVPSVFRQRRQSREARRKSSQTQNRHSGSGIKTAIGQQIPRQTRTADRRVRIFFKNAYNLNLEAESFKFFGCSQNRF